MAKLFQNSAQAAFYAMNRPTYPSSLYATVFQYIKKGDSPCQAHAQSDLSQYGRLGHRAVDVACGSGQSTRPLAPHFDEVVGLDISSAQIEEAKSKVTHNNLTFRVGEANKLPFPDASVDLVTVAQAIHWFDHSVFYKEIDRVLRKGGVFAFYGYGNSRFDNPQAMKVFDNFYWNTLKGFWDDRRQHLDDKYASIPHCYPNTIRIENDEISIKKEVTVNEFIGYLQSWSAYTTMMADKRNPDPMPALKQELKAALSLANDEEDRFQVEWPVFLFLALKKE